MSFRRLVKLYDDPCISGLNMLSEDQNDAINANLVNEIKANKEESLSKQNEFGDNIKVVHRIDVIENGNLGEPSSSSNKDNEEVNYQSKATVFVGNISFSVKQKELKSVLSKFGKIRHVILKKRKKERNLSGYGFVTFSNVSEADAAIKASEEVVCCERPLRICYSSKRRMGDTSRKTKKKKNKMEEMWPTRVLEDGNTKILHDDDLLLIFSHLSMTDLLGARCVCIRWKYLVGKQLSSVKKFPFRDARVSLFQNNVTVDAFQIMIGYCAHILTELDLSSYGFIVCKESVARISDSCPNLVNINFSNSGINNHGLKSLASKCKKIKIATLSRCSHFGEKGLWWFLHLLPDLTYLDITFNVRITGKCFNKMGTNLQSLFFNENHKLSQYGFSSIAFKCKSLSELQLINVMSLNDASFSNICQNCVTLKKLTITTKLLTSSGYMFIAQLPFLEELIIANNKNLDSLAVIQIARNCRNLKIVNISGPNNVCDRGVEHLGMCKNIVDLDLGYLMEIKDESLIKISKNGTLRRLCLRGCLAITDRSCVEILNCCPNLEYLDLSSCRITISLLDSFLYAVQARNNNLCLTVVVGGTCFKKENVNVSHPLLKLNFFNFCNKRLLTNDWQDDFYDEFDNYSSEDYESDNWEDEYDYDDVYDYDDEDNYREDDYWDAGYQ